MFALKNNNDRSTTDGMTNTSLLNVRRQKIALSDKFDIIDVKNRIDLININGWPVTYSVYVPRTCADVSFVLVRNAEVVVSELFL